MNDTAKISGRLLVLTLLGVATASGCVTWTGPLANRLDSTNAPLPLPSQQFPPTVRGVDPVAFEGAVSNAGRGTANSGVGGGMNQPPTHTEQVRPIGDSTAAPEPIFRGQQPDDFERLDSSDDYSRDPLPVSQPPSQPAPRRYDDRVQPAQYAQPSTPPYGNNGYPGDRYPGSDYGPAPPNYGNAPGYGANPVYGSPGYGPPADIPGTIGYGNPNGVPGPEFDPGPSDMVGPQPYTGRLADLIVNVREQQTGRFMFGVGVNSDAGLTAQIVIDEYNFDWRRFPRSVDDVINGTAFRGGGQRLRIEAIPGSELQRYMVNFTEPYLMDTNISLNLSAYLFDRQYFDWDEQRLGGRIALGYRLTPDLSLTGGLRVENVNVNDPRVTGVPELDAVLGDSSLFSGRVSLTHDTRDSPFAATEGHLLELSYEQVFGSFDYPRGVVDYRRYFLLAERPDGSGRHTLGTSIQGSISGSQTPLYENFFAGGYSTIRGFRFRGASPKSGDVFVGGELSILGSFEYMFPVTADDMLKGVVFCDYGTVEEELKIEKDDVRVAVGAGLRISIPAMGPAPIAVDFSVPIAREQTDRIQNFSFFVGFGR